MRNQAFLKTVGFVSILILPSCMAMQKQGGQTRSVSPPKEEVKREPLVTELNRLYEAAKSEQDRRSVCLRALDEGAVRRNGSVASIDAIFRTRFAPDLPTEKEGTRKAGILFAPQFSSPEPSDETRAVGYIGSYLDFDYDSNGAIQNYYISNLHKGASGPTGGKEPTSAVDLAKLYQAAKSERERRDVALRAIDEGVIQTFGPVKVSTVDAIFGTHFASQLPTRKEVTRTGIVDFASLIQTPTAQKDEASGSGGWFMAVEYYHDGSIANYYLTNVQK